MTYILTGPAARDIDEILDYISGQSVQTAVLVAERLEKMFRQITETPGIGHKRDELKDADARVVSVSGYLVIYDATLSPVHVLRVVRGGRNLGNVQNRS